jgi:arginase family enzyme
MLDEFLSPIRLQDIVDVETLSPDQIGNLITVHETVVPDIVGMHLAIVGVKDDRGSARNKGCAKAPDAIRKHFYQMFMPHKHLKIVDLGNLHKGDKPRDTYVALSKIVNELFQHKIVPIIIGGSHDLSYGQYGGYQEFGKMINVSVIDSFIDIRENEVEINADNFLINLLTHQPNFLFNYSQLAFQVHYASPLTIDTLDKLHFDMYRLGKVRENIHIVEPIMRDTDMLSIDISAVRYSDAPGNGNATPNGLSGEDICQIARYAGLSERLTSFGIYEINPVLDTRQQTVMLASQMIWYFMEGFANRKKLIPKDNDSDFTKFIVHMAEHNYELVFWKNIKYDVWWMEVPAGHKSKRPNKKHLIPCTYEDYQQACREELPERWLKTHEKLS